MKVGPSQEINGIHMSRGTVSAIRSFDAYAGVVGCGWYKSSCCVSLLKQTQSKNALQQADLSPRYCAADAGWLWPALIRATSDLVNGFPPRLGM